MDFNEMTKEELLGLLDNPEEIECGGDPWDNDEERDYQVKLIKNILVEKFGMNRKVL